LTGQLMIVTRHFCANSGAVQVVKSEPLILE